MSDTPRRCPSCTAEILSSAIKCEFCGHAVPPPPPAVVASNPPTSVPATPPPATNRGAGVLGIGCLVLFLLSVFIAVAQKMPWLTGGVSALVAIAGVLSVAQRWGPPSWRARIKLQPNMLTNKSIAWTLALGIGGLMLTYAASGSQNTTPTPAAAPASPARVSKKPFTTIERLAIPLQKLFLSKCNFVKNGKDGLGWSFVSKIDPVLEEAQGVELADSSGDKVQIMCETEPGSTRVNNLTVCYFARRYHPDAYLSKAVRQMNFFEQKSLSENQIRFALANVCEMAIDQLLEDSWGRFLGSDVLAALAEGIGETPAEQEQLKDALGKLSCIEVAKADGKRMLEIYEREGVLRWPNDGSSRVVTLPRCEILLAPPFYVTICGR